MYIWGSNNLLNSRYGFTKVFCLNFKTVNGLRDYRPTKINFQIQHTFEMKMIQLNPAIVLVLPKDLLKVFPHIKTRHGAWLHYHSVRESIGKEKHQRITVKELAEYEGLPVDDLLKVVTA